MINDMNIIQQNISLKPMNTFGIDAKASYFASVHDLDQFNLLQSHEIFHSVPKLVLGEGSNVLFTRDFDGLVIKNNIKGIQVISEDEDHVRLQVGAGENWHQFVMYCVEHGLGGVENLSLIPGTVGAAPIQNIGAYGVELKDTFFQLNALHLKTGHQRIFSSESCQFGYRDSIFKTLFKDQYAILSVEFQLNRKPNYHLDYAHIKETLQSMRVEQPSLKAISDAIIHIRRNKLPNPKELGNAGSFFKNPMVSSLHFEELKKSFPDIPFFNLANSDFKKIPAAWLIEHCGWKGKRFGSIGIYEKQALILVNYGGGTGRDIKELAEKIQHSVQSLFGIALVPEVNFI